MPIDVLLLVWLVAVVADTMEVEAVLTFGSAEVVLGAVADETVDDEVVMLLASADVVLLLVVLVLVGGAMVKASHYKS